MKNGIINNLWLNDNFISVQDTNNDIFMCNLGENLGNFKKIGNSEKDFNLTFSNNDWFLGVSLENEIIRFLNSQIFVSCEKFTKMVNENKRSIIDAAANEKCLAILLDNGDFHIKDLENLFGFKSMDFFEPIIKGVKKFQMTEDNLFLLGKNNHAGLLKNTNSDKGIENVKDISMSETHYLYLTEKNEVFIKEHDKSVPVIINAPEVEIKNVFAGNGRSFITDIDGNIYGSGKNNKGELGIDTNDSWVKFFKKIENFRGISKIFCAYDDFTVFLTKLGNVYACGNLNKIGEDGFSNSPKKLNLFKD